LCKNAVLALADGTILEGTSVGARTMADGEVVFNTAMTGYQEILTDPSYRKQIVTLTAPHIGNTGTNSEDAESDGIHAAGLVIRDTPKRTSNFRNELDLTAFLQGHGVPAIADIDTRKLTRILRDKGAQAGVIDCSEKPDPKAAIARARQFAGLAGMDLAREVTTAQTYVWNTSEWELGVGCPTLPDSALSHHVVAYDFGIKRNILRLLVASGCRVTVVPATTPAADVLAMQPDGVFLSNGPGDPEPCDYAIAAIQEFLQTDLPVFGICLGHQLLALACGAKTLKMKFGHHGANHPVQELDGGRVFITSQNHGFAVDPDSLPANVRATHRSLFDDSLQGIECTAKPAFSFQGHPEASPGPQDLLPLFAQFVAQIENRKNASSQ
jgi:carbamoyl-phosphate synthase small subunit